MPEEITQEERDLNVVKKHTALMMEHFDSVQIFATRYDGTVGTVRVSYGGGNFFARYGLAKLWVDSEYLDDKQD